MPHIQPDRSSQRDLKGFTLIEVMVVVSILAILIALAAPSFTPMIERWRIRQATEQLQSTLYYARSEAIKRGGQVTIQKLPNNTNGCTAAAIDTNWGCGWFVCEDSNSDGVCADTESVLQRYDAPANLQVSRNGGSTSIKLNRWGLVDGALPSFTLFPLGKDFNDPATSGLCMSLGGRIRIIPPGATSCT